MLKITLIGAGAMGEGVLSAIEHTSEVSISLIDNSQSNLLALNQKYGSVGISTYCASNENAVEDYFLTNKPDLVLLCLPWDATYRYLKLLAKNRVTTASITRAPNNKISEINKWYENSKTALLLPCGLEPGLVEILGAYITTLSEKTCESLTSYCGGITNRPRKPFNYTRVFGSILPFDKRDAYYRSEGELIKTKRFSDVKQRYVEGVGLLESYHDGLIPTVVSQSPFKEIPNLQQRSLRWPGFAQAVNQIHELGLWSDEVIDIDNALSLPKKALVSQMFNKTTKLLDNEKDQVILSVEAEFVDNTARENHRIDIIVRPNTMHGITAMAHITGKSLLLAAKQLLESDKVGLLNPHELLGDNIGLYLEQLQDEYITLKHY